MGRAYSIVHADLLTEIYERGAQHGVQLLSDTAFDDDALHIIRFMSPALEKPGENGMQDIIKDGDGFRFKSDRDV